MQKPTCDPSGRPNRLRNPEKIGIIYQNAIKNRASLGDDFWSLLVPLGRLWLLSEPQLGPKGPQNAVGGPPERTKRVPGGARWSEKAPKGAKTELMATEMKLVATKRELNGSRRQPKGSQGKPKEAKREPKGSQRATKCIPKLIKRYMQKSMPPKHEFSFIFNATNVKDFNGLRKLFSCDKTVKK